VTTRDGADAGSGALPAGALLAGHDDTIVAVATPPGRGALALVRLSGADAHRIGRALSRRWPAEARMTVHTAIRDADDTTLDDAVLVRYDAPASFTGEHMVEISTHGGSVVPFTVVAAAVELGARPALPGEFTRRAVFHGKLDLLQAEATGDLVAATSRAGQRAALDQLSGGLSRRIADLRSHLLGTEALLAYDIDFPEEDDGPLPTARILASLDEVERTLDALLATTRVGSLVRDGALVVLAGVPNAGKSSLFNALLGQERAIVTDLPGTTRDAIEAVLDVGRWPLRLVDTAGLRDSHDLVEQLGIAAGARYLSDAAVILACGESVTELRAAVDRAQPSGAPIILVATKSDRATPSAAALEELCTAVGAVAVVVVSATQATGLTQLTDEIMRVLDASSGSVPTGVPMLTHARHRALITRARGELAAFRHAWRGEGLPATVAAVHLHTAVASLEDMIGSVDVEEILGEVFSRFCVGK
jgi:tRNA modification GTPase